MRIAIVSNYIRNPIPKRVIIMLLLQAPPPDRVSSLVTFSNSTIAEARGCEFIMRNGTATIIQAGWICLRIELELVTHPITDSDNDGAASESEDGSAI